MAIDETDLAAWHELGDRLAEPPAPRYEQGPWNGRYLAPQTRRTARVHIEPLAPRITDLDYEAYMGSIDHLNRSFGSDWPTPDITPDAASLDLHGCWASFGRGEAFQFGVLTHDRDRELGCAYFWRGPDWDDPYETGLRIWTIESEVATDLDRHLLAAMLVWVDEEWDFNRVVYYVPRSYQRGLDIAVAADLREVDREPLRPGDACFQWERHRP